MRWKFTLNPDTDNLLISEPIGWDDIEFTILRDKEWHGVFFEYSVPVLFYNDPIDTSKNAYTYLRAIYNTNGIAGSVILKVEMACDDTDTFTEEAQWRLDFSTYKEKRGIDCLIEMQVEPDNMLMTFRNRYNQKVDIATLSSFDGTALTDYDKIDFNLLIEPKAVPVFSDLKHVGTSEDITLTQIDTIVAGTGTATHSVIAYIQLGYNLIVLDEVSSRLEISSQAFTSFPSIEATWKISIPGDYDLSFPDFTFTINAFAGTEADNTACGIGDTYNDLELEVWVDVGGVATLLDSDSLSGCLSSGDTITMDLTGLSHAFTVTTDTEVKLYIRIAASGEWDKDLLSENEINWEVNYNQPSRNVVLSGTEYYDATSSKVSMVNEVGSRILEAITNDNYRFLSNYYGRTDSQPYPAPDEADGCGSLRVLTNGLLLRQFGSAKLNLSFKQFFEGLNPIDNIGIGLEDDADRSGYQVIRCEEAGYFYDDTVLLQLDKIPYVEITINKEEHYSNVEIGYKKWEAEEYSGLDEFATKRIFRTVLTSIENTFSKLTEFIASGYALELTRRKTYLDTSKEDWRFDNDTFVVCVKRGGSGAIVVEQGNITGEDELIDAPTVYNWRISPIRNLLRWLKTVLNSYRNPIDSDSDLIYVDGDGNTLATGTLTDGCVIEAGLLSENQNVSSDDLINVDTGLPIYVPETWEFEYPLSLSDYNLIKAAPTQTIQGRFGQDTEYLNFYIREIKFKPNKGLALWKLLPKRYYAVDECLIYVVQTRGIGTNIVGSAILYGATLANLFVFVNGELMKYNDANSANNEIVSFDALTGMFTLSFNVPVGQQVSIFHLPPGDGRCGTCYHRYEGRGSGSTTKVLTGFGGAALSNSFVFYNGQLLKYNDAVAANNEAISYVSGTETLTTAGATNVNRELRAFGFVNCGCVRTYSNRGDGTTTPTVSVGEGTLANVFAFYNGNLMKYNDVNPANNEIIGYDSDALEVTLNFTTNANRELRAFKLSNC